MVGTITRDAPSDLDQLVTEYVDLRNEVIAENQHRFFYRQAKRLNRKVWGESQFRTIVYDRNPADPVAEYVLHYDPGAHADPGGKPLSAASVADAPAENVAFSWKVSVDYLRDVVERWPDWYRRHPVMLDWTWFTQRLRDEVRIRRRLLVAALAGATAGGAVALRWTRAAGAKG